MFFIKKIKDAINKKRITEQIHQKNESANLLDKKRFDKGMSKSAKGLKGIINNITKKYHKIDEQLIENIEEELLTFDIGPHATTKICDAITNEIKLQKATKAEQIKEIIVEKLLLYYVQDGNYESGINLNKDQTNVILVTGVNGVGKTTSIGKMANFFLQQKKSVILVAGDTFRAGAIEQLDSWAKKLKIPIFKPKNNGQDPASVVYEGVKHASEKKIDIVICDTSGRLQTKTNLMNELKKINDIIHKFLPDQPCESLLVLDATTGQNGIFQAKAFNEVTKISGIILTKMDSTAKGGIVLAIKDAFNIPIKFIGLGEQINDFARFDAQLFIDGLTSDLNLK